MKYAVTFYFSSNCTFKVEADNENEAWDKACTMLDSKEAEKQIVDGLQEVDTPTIEKI